MVLEQFGFASRLRDGRQVLGSPGGPFQCDVCLQRFPTRGSLGSHKTYKHGAPEVAPIAVQAADPGALIESLLTPWEGAPVLDADEMPVLKMELPHQHHPGMDIFRHHPPIAGRGSAPGAKRWLTRVRTQGLRRTSGSCVIEVERGHVYALRNLRVS